MRAMDRRVLVAPATPSGGHAERLGRIGQVFGAVPCIEGRAIGRVQVPEDLVGAVMFLSSAASDFMTGQTVNVDGGKAMH